MIQPHADKVKGTKQVCITWHGSLNDYVNRFLGCLVPKTSERSSVGSSSVAESGSFRTMGLCLLAVPAGEKTHQRVSLSAAMSSNSGDFLVLMRSLRSLTVSVGTALPEKALDWVRHRRDRKGSGGRWSWCFLVKKEGEG